VNDLVKFSEFVILNPEGVKARVVFCEFIILNVVNGLVKFSEFVILNVVNDLVKFCELVILSPKGVKDPVKSWREHLQFPWRLVQVPHVYALP